MSEPIRSISRRHFGLAISLPWFSGCGFGPFDPVRSVDARAGRIRIVTPWGEGLRDRFEKSFAAWLVKNAIGPVSIRWLTVTDSEMVTISLAKVLSSADVILGGHRHEHERSNLTGIKQSGLKASRFPVIRTIRPKGQLTAASKDVDSNEPKNPLQVFDQRAASSPFEFSGNSNDPLVQAFFLAIFEDAPDQAAGYARWIRTVGSSVGSRSPISAPCRILQLSEYQQIDRPLESLWTGGPGMKRMLGIGETAPVHWPESMTWKIDGETDANLGHLLRFCEETGWLTRRSTQLDSDSHSTVIRDLMARIVRQNCRTELMQAWSEIQVATGTRRQETESYLTAPPPWPPASIQALRQERGFEFVVALADQMAIDGPQRDWLVEEFGKPGGPIDFRMLESANNDRLVKSTRAMAWLHAEWTAWLKQRCRRSVRFLRTSNASHGPNPDFRRSGATIFT